MRTWANALRCLLLLGALLGCRPLLAQSARVDPTLRPLLSQGELAPRAVQAELPRLHAWLRAHPADTLGQLLAYSRLAFDYMALLKDDSIYMYLHHARRVGARLAPAYPLERAVVLRELGNFHHFGRSRYDSALYYFGQARQLLLGAGYPTGEQRPVRLADGSDLVVGQELAFLNRDYAAVLTYQGRLRAAVDQYEESLRYLRRLHDNVESAAVLRRLGQLHTRLGQADKAKFYFNQVLSLALQQPNARVAVLMLASTLESYTRLVMVPAEKQRLLAVADTARQRLRPLLRAQPTDVQLLSQGARLAVVEARCAARPAPALARLDSLLTRLRRVAKPAELMEWSYAEYRLLQQGLLLDNNPAATGRALRYLDSLPSSLIRFTHAVWLAERFNQTRQPRAVVQLLAPLLTDSIRGDLVERRAALEQLTKAYASLGNYPAAYATRLRYDALEDSLRSDREQAALTALQVRYRTAQKEQRIAQLTEQHRRAELRAERQQGRVRLLAVGVAGLLLLLLVFGVLYRRLLWARAQAEAATRAKDQLYSLIAHDLRGPLTAFTGLADVLSFYRQQGDFQALDELTGEVRDTALRLTRLLDNLLHWAAAETGELRPHPEPLAAAPLLHEVAALYAAAARARQVQVQVMEPAAELYLHADRNMTLTILRNLVGNALKVAPPGSGIILGAEATAAGVSLSVRDGGPGLSAEQLLSVRMAPADQPTRTALFPGGRERGTGLGLPLVHRLTRLQHGQFSFDSAPGQGSTVCVLLPAA